MDILGAVPVWKRSLYQVMMLLGRTTILVLVFASIFAGVSRGDGKNHFKYRMFFYSSIPIIGQWSTNLGKQPACLTNCTSRNAWKHLYVEWISQPLAKYLPPLPNSICVSGLAILFLAGTKAEELDMNRCHDLAEDGDCRFFLECLEKRIPCGPGGYAVSHGYDICNKYHMRLKDFNNKVISYKI